MAVRIADFVFSGELRNTSRNRVFGWIEFAPDYGIFLELTGNFSGKLAGKHIRFRRSASTVTALFEPGAFPDFIEHLANRQIGVVETVEMRRSQVPSIPLDEFLALSDEQRPGYLVEKECLILEWSSQNGRVISELVEPELEFVDDLGDEAAGSEPPAGMNNSLDGSASDYLAAITGGLIGDEDGTDTPFADLDDDEEDEDDADEDPYGLFGDELKGAVEQSLGPPNDLMADPEDMVIPRDQQPRSWDDVIPGIDPATKQLYEQWDEIFEGKKDEPISYLFPTVLKLPKPEQVSSEAEAEILVKKILAQLALLSVAVDICEHFTMLDTYRLLIDQLLPEARVHPNLAASEMVQHYATSEFCSQCEEELGLGEYDDDDDDDDDEDDDEDDEDEDDLDEDLDRQEETDDDR